MYALLKNTLVSRLIAVSLLFLTVFSAADLILIPLLDSYEELNDQVVNQRALLQRYEQRLRALPSAKSHALLLNEQIASSDVLLRSKSRSQAMGALQGLVEATVRQQGGQLTSTRALPNRKVESFDKVSLIAESRIPEKALLQTLYRLKNQKPTLIVERLTLRQTRVSSRKLDTAAPVAPLTVRFEVSGFMLSEDP